jgi:ribonuclease P protein component
METLKPRATFKKEERLTARKAIGELMEKGQTITVSPLRMVWNIVTDQGKYPAQIAFAVPKKIFPLAVDRNRVRRQLREIYRKNKWILYSLLKERNLRASILLVYTKKEKPLYPELEKKFHLAVRQLEERLS